ncbi:hypothetical protein TNCV_1414731 [Trichonephila clavipes]|nr:hypothetical protein TNCV_1414731 [Trichonephila clavipes]
MNHPRGMMAGIVVGVSGVRATENPPCKGAMHVSSVESSNVFPLGINSVSTSDPKTAQLEQQISQITQQVISASFMKRSRRPTRNSKQIRNRSNSF